jgi:hypothetical protein
MSNERATLIAAAGVLTGAGCPDMARAVLATLTPPAPAEDAAGWQPIETAPKDGTSVLLYTASGLIEGYWSFGEWEQCAIYCTYDGAGGPAFGCKPTHWMPLPASPAAIESIERRAE